MMERSVNVFFYGSYMNFEVLKEAEINERAFENGCLHGYALSISPLANLKKEDEGRVYGILTRLSHPELDRLYTEHARGKLGGVYLPEAVTVYLRNGLYTSALCYISHNMVAGEADPAYVTRILKPATEYGFPEWYLNHIASYVHDN